MQNFFFNSEEIFFFQIFFYDFQENVQFCFSLYISLFVLKWSKTYAGPVTIKDMQKFIEKKFRSGFFPP